jgi:hypothetical protein
MNQVVVNRIKNGKYNPPPQAAVKVGLTLILTLGLAAPPYSVRF